jgi:hypothetical protein
MWNDATAVYAEIVTYAGATGKVEFNHCERDLNMVAHSLARECFISKEQSLFLPPKLFTWLIFPP